MDRHAEAPGQVVVAGACVGDRCARAGLAAGDGASPPPTARTALRWPGRPPGRRAGNSGGDPAPPPSIRPPAANSRQMAARRLRRDAGREGELLRRPRPPVHERGENVGAGRIAHQGGRLGEKGFGAAHGAIGADRRPRRKGRRFGRGRSVSGATGRRAAGRVAGLRAGDRYGCRHATARLVDYALLLAARERLGRLVHLIKIGIETIPPVTLIAARTLIAGAVLLAVMRLARRCAAAGPGVLAAFAFQALHEQRPALHADRLGGEQRRRGLAAILNSTTPIFTFLITVAITRHEPAGAQSSSASRWASPAHAWSSASRRSAGSASPLSRSSPSWSPRSAMPWRRSSAATSRGSTRWCRRPARSLRRGDPRSARALWSTGPGRSRPRRRRSSPCSGWRCSRPRSPSRSTSGCSRRSGSVGTTAQAYLRVPIGVGIGALALGESLAPTAALGLALRRAGVIAMTVPTVVRKRPIPSPSAS